MTSVSLISSVCKCSPWEMYRRAKAPDAVDKKCPRTTDLLPPWVCSAFSFQSAPEEKRPCVCGHGKALFFQALTTDAARYHEFSQTPLLNCFTVTTEGSFNLILVWMKLLTVLMYFKSQLLLLVLCEVGSCSVAQADFELGAVFRRQPLKYWDYEHESLHPAI